MKEEIHKEMQNTKTIILNNKSKMLITRTIMCRAVNIIPIIPYNVIPNYKIELENLRWGL